MKLGKSRRTSAVLSAALAAAAAAAAPLPLAAPAQAAQTTDGPQNAVRIQFDGEPLVADAAAFIREGTTFVPFRALFERLGMTVAWDASARTIVGTKDDLSITLQADSRDALVAGTLYSLPLPPVITDGRTFVPLRFVSEHAGALVDWDSATRTVSIRTAGGGAAPGGTPGTPPGASPAPSPGASPGDAALAAYESFVEAVQREDAASALRLVHPDSPLRAAMMQSLADAFARRDVSTTLLSHSVESEAEERVVLRVRESNQRMRGAYYIDNETELLVTMVREGGVWYLYGSDMLSRQWTSPFGEPSAAPDPIPERDEEAARNAIASYLDALNREDLAGALRIVHPESPMREATSQTLSWLFETYDLEHALESVRVLERSDDEMYVHSVQVMSKTDGPPLSDVRTEYVHTLRLSQGGQWRLYASVEGERQVLSLPR